MVVAEQSSESTPIMICWPAWPAEDLETSDRYIAVPHKNELGLGRDLALSFIRSRASRRLGIPRQGFSEEGSVRPLDLLHLNGWDLPLRQIGRTRRRRRRIARVLVAA